MQAVNMKHLEDFAGSVAVVVSSCDAFFDTWRPFAFFFQKFWTDCPFPVYLIVNELEVRSKILRPLRVGKDQGWATNMQIALERIETPYILYFQDDYFLTGPVNQDQLAEDLAHAVEQNADSFSFCDLSLLEPDFAQTTSRFEVVPADSKGRTRLQTALWKREAFASILRAGENAWNMEARGSERTRDLRIFSYAHNVPAPIPYLMSGIVRGLWTREGKELCRAHEVRIRPLLPTDAGRDEVGPPLAPRPGTRGPHGRSGRATRKTRRLGLDRLAPQGGRSDLHPRNFDALVADAASLETRDSLCLRGDLSDLGIDLSRHSFRDRIHPAAPHGGHAILHRRSDHVRDRADARRAAIRLGRLADGGDCGRVSITRRQRRRHARRTICRVRPSGRYRRDRPDLHRSARLVDRRNRTADSDHLAWAGRRILRRGNSPRAFAQHRSKREPARDDWHRHSALFVLRLVRRFDLLAPGEERSFALPGRRPANALRRRVADALRSDPWGAARFRLRNR